MASILYERCMPGRQIDDNLELDEDGLIRQETWPQSARLDATAINVS